MDHGYLGLSWIGNTMKHVGMGRGRGGHGTGMAPCNGLAECSHAREVDSYGLNYLELD